MNRCTAVALLLPLAGCYDFSFFSGSFDGPLAPVDASVDRRIVDAARADSPRFDGPIDRTVAQPDQTVSDFAVVVDLAQPDYTIVDTAPPPDFWMADTAVIDAARPPDQVVVLDQTVRDQLPPPDLVRLPDLLPAPGSWVPEARGDIPLNVTLNGVWGSSLSDMYIVMDGGGVAHSTGPGNWVRRMPPPDPTMRRLNVVWGFDANEVYAAGNDDIAMNRIFPADWVITPFDIMLPIDVDTYGIRGFNRNEVYGVGFCRGSTPLCNALPPGIGGVGRWSSSGWELIVTSTNPLYGIWGTSDKNIYVVGQQGVLLHYQQSDRPKNSGQEDTALKWKQETVGAATLRAIAGNAAGNDIWVVGGESGARLFRNDGASMVWMELSPSLGVGVLNAIWSNGSEFFAVGQGGTIIHFKPGIGWFSEPSPTTRHLRAVWGLPSGHVYAVGDNATILRRTPP